MTVRTGRNKPTASLNATSQPFFVDMLNTSSESRSDSDRNSTIASSPSDSSASGAEAPSASGGRAPRGRKHPALATVRLKHGTKGRAKDAARAQNMSLCAFIRAAVRDALDDALDHQENPDAV